jgi:leader peptidase (prepilin peptidase)/N-methyltransferase
LNLFDVPRGFVLATLFLLGSCIGSFLNVCIHRFPSRHRLRDQLRALNSHGSGCPRCAAAIRWRDNVPLLGWLMLRGRCRNCRRPISARYPLVEALTAFLFVAVYQCEMPPEGVVDLTRSGLFVPDGPQTLPEMWSADLWLHVRYALHMAMICGLIVATFIDAELKIIPDGCTIPVLILALVASAAFGQIFIVPLWFQGFSEVNTLRPGLPGWLQTVLFYWDCGPFAAARPHLHGLLVSVAGCIVGGGAVWTVRLIGFWVLRQEAMGFGDVVLMGMIGSVIGWQPVMVVFFMAPILAVAAAVIAWVSRRHREIPYGPWLSLAALLLILFWPRIWPMAKPVFDLGPILLLMGCMMVVSLVVSLQLIQLLKRFLGIDRGVDAPILFGTRFALREIQMYSIARWCLSCHPL